MMVVVLRRGESSTVVLDMTAADGLIPTFPKRKSTMIV